MKKWLLAAVALILIGATGGVIIFQISAITIKITNSTGDRVTDLKCVMSTNDLKQWTEQFADLNAGQSHQFSRHVSDLYIHSLEYRIRDVAYKWEEGGIATTGECYRLNINGAGKVSTSYEEK